MEALLFKVIVKTFPCIAGGPYMPLIFLPFGKMIEDDAKAKEKQLLANFRKNNGKNPKYNKDSDG